MTPEPFSTIAEMFLQVTARDVPGLMQSKRDGAWQPLPAREIRRRVARLSALLLQQGLERGDRVAILSENSPEWAIADYACTVAGLVVVPIYPTLTAEQTQYILEDSGARAAFVSNEQQANKTGGVRAIEMAEIAGLCGTEPLTAEEERELVARCATIQASDLFTILYTSGTTGQPKGVMLSHRNLASNIQASKQLVQAGDIALSFLPLSHIFERMADYTYLYHGASIAYVASLDEVPAALLEVRPTVMCAVPRFFEKLYDRVVQTVKQAGGVREWMFWWAFGLGKRRLEYTLNGRPVPAALAVQYLAADKLVFSVMRHRMGGRLRIIVSGSAPLARELAEFFLSCGILLLEGYGLTETSPVLCANVPGAIRLGTVGRAISNVELRIAEDGEILARGPNIMMGYYKRPEETAQAIEDGWFHTGDVGMIDADGYLTITDRKKDMMKTAGGKFIAPQPIENRLRSNPYISNAVVIGDRRKFVSALIVPNLERVAAYARARGLEAADPAVLLHHPMVIEFMQRQVDEATSHLAHFEKIKKILLLEHDFSIAGGTLTPTLKARRAVITAQYEEQIDALYA
jgi:long-chain acyl-CoA synthetase